MNPEKINARYLELSKQEADLQAAIVQNQANLNAVIGAKQDCQYWLSQIAEAAIATNQPQKEETHVDR